MTLFQSVSIFIQYDTPDWYILFILMDSMCLYFSFSLNNFSIFILYDCVLNLDLIRPPIWV